MVVSRPSRVGRTCLPITREVPKPRFLCEELLGLSGASQTPGCWRSGRGWDGDVSIWDWTGDAWHKQPEMDMEKEHGNGLELLTDPSVDLGSYRNNEMRKR